jgi:hypothetical protein
VERSGTHQHRTNDTEGKLALEIETAEYRFAEYEYEYEYEYKTNLSPSVKCNRLNDPIDPITPLA